MAADPDFFQVMKNIAGHAGRQIHIAEIVVDIDMANMDGIQTGFIGNGTNDITGFDFMLVPNLNAVALQTLWWLGVPGTAWPGFSGTCWPAVCTARVSPARICITRRTGTAVWLVVTVGAGVGWFVGNQQVTVAQSHLRQCRGNFQRRNVMLSLVLFNNILQKIQAASAEDIGDALLKTGNTLVVHHLGTGQFQLGNLLPCGALNSRQHAGLARCHKQNGLALTTGSTGSANAMDIGFGVIGNIVVDHVANSVDVQAPGGDIGGHQNVEGAVFQAFDHLFPLFLHHIAIQGRGRVATRLKALGQFGSGSFGADKNQHGIKGFHFQNAGQGIQFVGVADQPVTLRDGLGGGGQGLDFNNLGLAQVFLRDTFDFFWHGGGEQRHLPIFWQLLKDPFDIIKKAHTQHFIGFIKDQSTQARQV